MNKLITLMSLLSFCACSNAADINNGDATASPSAESAVPVDGREYEKLFKAPNGTQEACVALAKIPGGDYSKKDREKEAEYCTLSLYQEGFALCPKTWSTSPGTMIYDVRASKFSRDSYEASSRCGAKTRGDNVSTFAKFKQTMNASGTSGTLSQSSLMYYHFSRYLDAKVIVPVAVYREMDKDMHLARVTKKGRSKSTAKMNKAGWNHLYNAEKNPQSYSPTSDLFTADRQSIYGVLLKGKGERYGTEFNGTRASGWGVGQNRDFQKTPGFLALRESGDLRSAVSKGLEKAKRDSKMRKDLVGVSELQMVYWMRELIELTLMDYIFSQQDRVGNIDYEWFWYYVKDGKVESKKEKRSQYEDLSRRSMRKIIAPDDIIGYNPVLLQRTNLNDNDAGGRVAYANFSKKTNMLSNLKHYSAKTYTRLMELDRDLQSKGPVYQWLVNSIDLTDRRVNQIISNTHKAANILRGQCQSLIFDLDDVDNYLLYGARVEKVDCSL